MRRAVALAFAIAATLAHPVVAHAQGLGMSNQVFVRALVDGRAMGPVPDRSAFSPLIESLQKQSGDDGTIVIQAMRTVRFVQQPRCGRVVFALAQPSSHRAWPALGAQLNICEDGQPPLRVCTDRPQVLVPPSTTCRDNKRPVDTEEIASAIAAALSAGDLSAAQVRTQAVAAMRAAAASEPKR
jgi:hypothetical protein